MRNYIASIVVIICIILLPLKVNAVNPDEVVNSNGVVIPINLYFDLQQIYSDAYIDTLTEDDLDRIINMNIDFDNIHQEVKYIKTEYNNITGEIVNTEVTEAEYLNANPNINNGPQATIVETAYKKIILSVSPTVTGYAYFAFTCFWKIMPATRSFDVIAARFNGLDYINGTQQGKQIYTLNGTTSYVQYNYNGTNINNLSNGFGISMNLLDANVTYLECTIDASLVVNSSVSLVAASYQHAITDLDLATSKNYYLGAGGAGDVIYFNNGVGSYYDNMDGTYYYLYT